MDRSTGHHRDAGFTLVEVMAATVLMTASLIGLGLVFVSSQRSQEMGVEEAVVSHAMRRTVEQMRGEAFAEVATLYTGYQFTLSEINGSGTVTVIVDETANVPELGMPRDLDGDGDATSSNVTASYVLLPVRVDVSWPDSFGDQTRTLYTFLSQES